MSNADAFSMGGSPDPVLRAVVEQQAPVSSCHCPPEERVPLSKLDRQDPILRAYLAEPAAPNNRVVSPLRTQARREAAGIGFSVSAVLLLLLLIALGTSLISIAIALAISAVFGGITRAIIWGARMPAIRKDEAKLAELAQALQAVFQARRSAWERLTYCPTHRCVVDGATGESRPLHAAHELLVLSPVASSSTYAPA